MSIEFFFDIASPYSYLAATQIGAIGQRVGLPVLWRPFLLGGVFRAVGNQPPATLTARAPYLMADLYRWAKHYDVPFAFPSVFPMNSLLAMRALTAVPPLGRPEAALSLFQAYWANNLDLTRPEVIARLIGEGPTMAAVDPDIKGQLRSATEQAVERGAFGAPTIFVGEEMFFGNDRLHFVEAAAKKIAQAMV
ncbi:MAG: 2-hydroxychromene-2-carboxylate isomerase [Myxococcota bacterium]|jgi:2-hydroxychromene-2-carboxylate isomerase